MDDVHVHDDDYDDDEYTIFLRGESFVVGGRLFSVLRSRRER